MTSNSFENSLRRLSVETLDAAIARASLTDFIRQGWHVLEPSTPLVWNWHVEAIACHVQATLEDWAKAHASGTPQRIRNLLINIPPGTAKSRIVSVFAPAWMWLRHPNWRAIFISSNPRVSLRDSSYCRELLESDWYVKTFRPTWRLADDQNAKSLYRNTANGFRMAISVGSRIVGDRADALFIDDPNDAAEVFSKTVREGVNEWWDQAAYNRVNDPQRSVRIGIMQRLHEDDWSGHILAGGGWEHLCLPQEFDPAIARTTAIGWTDPRTVAGELLFPARFPLDILNQERARLGSAGYAGQHQQRPSPAEGGMFRNSWWRFWRHAWEEDVPELKARTVILPQRFSRKVLSWDMAFKKTADSDFVAGGAWGEDGANVYLLDMVWRQLGFTDTVTALHEQAAAQKDYDAILIEDKANGPAVIDTVKRDRTLHSVIAVEPEGGKEARASATSPQVEAGNVFLPLHASWRDKYIEEHGSFPRGAHDDAVDQQSQFLLWRRARSVDYMGQFENAPKRRM